MVKGLFERPPVFFLAPMAGITNQAFRLLARRCGCHLVVTEMVNARGVVENSKNTLKLLRHTPEERPLGLQLFGSDPGVMAEAARAGVESGFDFIDLNMGCPTPKIVRNGEGAALMNDLPLAQKIMERVAGAVQVPVSVKLRKGWGEGGEAALPLSLLAEESGIAWVALHGRTREQFYRGRADWGIIRKVKERVGIPVVGNGDLVTPGDCRQMLRETGCDGLMVGRGALGNPWIFQRAIYYLEAGELLPGPGLEEIVAMARRHLGALVELKGEKTGVQEMRKHAAWYIKGIRGAARWRREINACETREEMEKVLERVGQSQG